MVSPFSISFWLRPRGAFSLFQRDAALNLLAQVSLRRNDLSMSLLGPHANSAVQSNGLAVEHFIS
jgi:hypothetical protein